MSLWNSWKIKNSENKQSQRIAELKEQVKSLQQKINDCNPEINSNLITKEYIQELAENTPNNMEWDVWYNDATLHFYHNGNKLKDTFIHLNFGLKDKRPSITAWSNDFDKKIYNLYLDGVLVFTKDNLNLFIDIFNKLIKSE